MDVFFVSGSRNSLVSLEARTVDAATLTRKCILIRWNELSEALWATLHEQNAGSVLIMLPRNISAEHVTVTVGLYHYLNFWSLQEA